MNKGLPIQLFRVVLNGELADIKNKQILSPSPSGGVVKFACPEFNSASRYARLAYYVQPHEGPYTGISFNINEKEILKSDRLFVDGGIYSFTVRNECLVKTFNLNILEHLEVA